MGKEAREEKETNLLDLEGHHQVKAKERGKAKEKVAKEDHPVRSQVKKHLSLTLDHALVM